MFCNPLNSLKINTEKISNDTNFIFSLIPSVLITFIVNLSCQINFTRTTKSNNTSEYSENYLLGNKSFLLHANGNAISKTNQVKRLTRVSLRKRRQIDRRHLGSRDWACYHLPVSWLGV